MHMTAETKEAFSAWVSDFITRVGFPVAVCSVMLWFGGQHVQKLTDSQEKASDWVREKFAITLENNTAAMRGVESAIKDNTEAQKVDGEIRKDAVKAIELLDDAVNRLHAKGGE